MQLYKKKKISIIVERCYKFKVLSITDEAGASGYTLYNNIEGRGSHGAMSDYGLLSEMSGNVEIVIICSGSVADKIFAGLQYLIEDDITLIVNIIEVQVMRDEHFA